MVAADFFSVSGLSLDCIFDNFFRDVLLTRDYIRVVADIYVYVLCERERLDLDCLVVYFELSVKDRCVCVCIYTWAELR